MPAVAMPPSELATILDRIRSERIFDGLKFETLLTREEWGNVLGIHRNTIPRWEQKIIGKVAPISNNYFTVCRMRSPYLDPYQRFILSVIYVVKGGLEHKNKPHKDVVNFLKVNFMNLKREQFECWRDNQNG